MLKKTIVLQGIYHNGKAKFKINGGFFGKIGDPTIENPCVQTAIHQIFSLLGRRSDEVKKTLCFNELVSPSVVKYLDYWIKKEKMMFFVWKGQYGHIFAFFSPFISPSFEIDDLLEELLDITTIDPNLRSCCGVNDDLMSYDVTRASAHALEVIGHQANSGASHVAFVGSGTSLRKAIRRVSSIMSC
jgi:hypothetical protein